MVQGRVTEIETLFAPTLVSLGTGQENDNNLHTEQSDYILLWHKMSRWWKGVKLKSVINFEKALKSNKLSSYLYTCYIIILLEQSNVRNCCCFLYIFLSQYQRLVKKKLADTHSKNMYIINRRFYFLHKKKIWLTQSNGYAC